MEFGGRNISTREICYSWGKVAEKRRETVPGANPANLHMNEVVSVAENTMDGGRHFWWEKNGSDSNKLGK